MSLLIRLLTVLVILVSLTVGISSAVTTGVATSITSNSTVLQGTGCSDVCWFQYGLNSGNTYPWRSYNVTAVGGAFATEIAGLPLIPSQKYYYKAYDENGDVGSESSFTLLPPNTYAEPTFGQHVENMTKYKWRVPVLAMEIPGPYFDVAPATVFFGVMFFFMYAGIWISGRNTLMPTVLGVVTAGMIMYTGATSIGMPPEFVHIGQGLLIASFAGIIFWLFKR